MLRNDEKIPALVVGGKTGDPSKLCAMEYISHENGDAVITDYPACSSHVAARTVQAVNDLLGLWDNPAVELDTYRCMYLSPQSVVAVLRLGDLTKGTEDTPVATEVAWLEAMYAERRHNLLPYQRDDVYGAILQYAQDPVKYHYAGSSAAAAIIRSHDLPCDYDDLLTFAERHLLRLREMGGLDAAPEPTLVGAAA